MDDISDIPFSRVIEALLDSENLFPPHYLYRLSDLEQDELEALKIAWHRVPTWRRQAVLEEVEDRCGEDYIHSFIDFAGFAAQDDDPKVRLLAVRVLWEYEAPDYNGVPNLYMEECGDRFEKVTDLIAEALKISAKTVSENKRISLARKFGFDIVGDYLD